MTKKFQSMYDKKSADYEKLNKEVEELLTLTIEQYTSNLRLSKIQNSANLWEMR